MLEPRGSSTCCAPPPLRISDIIYLFISDSIFISEPLPHSSDSDESDAETEDGSIHSVSSWTSSVQVTADIFFPLFSSPFSLSFSHSLNFPTFFFTLLRASFSSLFFLFFPFCVSSDSQAHVYLKFISPFLI